MPTGAAASIESFLNTVTGGQSRATLLSPGFTAALNAVDGFFAGMADALTGGASTWLRTQMYGEAATQNHSGPWFTAGSVVGGIIGGIIGSNVCSLGTVFQIVARGMALSQFVGDGVQAVQNIMAGNYLAAGMNILGMVASFQAMRSSCFTGDHMLRSIDGKIRFDELKRGDRVASCNEFDPYGPIEYKEVEEVFVTEADISHLHLQDGKIIRTTSEHPFYVWDKGWTKAQDLRRGDPLRADDGKTVTVKEVISAGYAEKVYNCRVADHHTYFVGGEDWGFSVWAHNTYTLSPTPAKPSVYSVAYETRLTGSQLGLSRARHFQIANEALQAERAANPALAALVPAPVGWGRSPAGWTWQHATIAQGGGEAGVLQLVPRSQHTSGSAFWSLFHPLPGSGGGYAQWAVPAGAP
jgi:hypothetical protein